MHTGHTLNEDLYLMLADSSIDAIIATDMAGAVTVWNKAAADAYDKTNEEATGALLTNSIAGMADDPDGMRSLQLALSGFKSFLPADKNIAYRRHAETHFLPLVNADREQIGVMQITHDISHRIKAERLLEELNKQLHKQNQQLERTMNEMASFTQISSNNIKTPIRNLYTDVEFLIKSEAGRLTDTGKGTFRRMQSSLNKMNLLLDDLLQLSEISVVKPLESIELGAVFTDVLARLKNKIEEKNAAVKLADSCTVTGNADLLNKLFYHLLDNAVKFNENAAPVVNISCDRVQWTPPSESMANDFYRVTISDNGIGIAGDDIEKAFIIFEKVHGGKYRGSGVGLAVAKKIMHTHNGFITLESSPETGTSCNCYFPVVSLVI